MPDSGLFNSIHSLAGQSKILDWLAIFLANYLAYFLILGTIIFLLREKNWKKRFLDSAFIGLSLVFSRGLLTEIIRFLYSRTRPFAVLNFEPLIGHEATAAFPSGHAAFYFALAFALLFLSRRLGIWYIVAATFMGAARVFVGVHWPLDIVAGALVGLISVFVVRWLLALHKS